jgi:hypothetical protein
MIALLGLLIGEQATRLVLCLGLRCWYRPIPVSSMWPSLAWKFGLNLQGCVRIYSRKTFFLERPDEAG